MGQRKPERFEKPKNKRRNVEQKLHKISLVRRARNFVDVFESSGEQVAKKPILFFLSEATFVEGSFALWVGYRGYDYFSHQSKGSYETISEIPLLKGRSKMSEPLCPEWIGKSETTLYL